MLKSEAERLIKKAERFLKSAQLLLEDEDYDSSVSRSYYAVLLAAQAALAQEGITPSSHRGAISLFGEHLVKTGRVSRELGKTFHILLDLRLAGDYSTDIIDKTDAERALKMAKKFVEAVKTIVQVNN